MSEGFLRMVSEEYDKSAPVVREHQDRGLADREEHDRLMASVPCPADSSSTCTLAHVDGCPECVTNTEPPEHREATPHGCVCSYKCHDCGHVWETAWGCA